MLDATLIGSCSAIHPNLQPGRRKRLERPARVMMGTDVDREAIGTKGPSHTI
jgi:hypothetical protein